MKLKILSILSISFLFTSCFLFEGDDDSPPQKEKKEEISSYQPIILSREAFEKAVKVSDANTIDESGKIYIKDDLLFINEVHKGFHVFDNTDTSNPTPIAFIEAPGATDMAIRNETIFINQAVDLIAVRYDATSETIAIDKRIKNTFPPITAPDKKDISTTIASDAVIVGWKTTTTSN